MLAKWKLTSLTKDEGRHQSPYKATESVFNLKCGLNNIWSRNSMTVYYSKQETNAAIRTLHGLRETCQHNTAV